MRILFLSNLYPPNVCGGYERLCFSVAKALASQGHAVGVLTSSYGGCSEEYPGQQIWRSLILLATEGNIYEPFCAPVQRLADINGHNIIEFTRVADTFSPDVIFVWNLYFFDASLLHEIENRFGGKAVYFLTDNWLINFYNCDFLGQYFPCVVFGRKCLEELACQGPSRTLQGRAIFGSVFMEQFYTAAGVTFSRSKVIHNGVPLPEIAEDCHRDRLLPVRHGTLRLLVAGRVVDVKGVHTALSALPLIAASLPGVAVSLDIVGDCQDESYRTRLAQIMEADGTTDMVHFRDSVCLDALFDLFQEYDLYLFPSLYEPFALTLIHALHAGIPTVASDVGGNVEIVVDQETGRIFGKDDAGALAACAVSLYRSPLSRNRISRKARETAWDFTFERMIRAVAAELAKTSL